MSGKNQDRLDHYDNDEGPKLVTSLEFLYLNGKRLTSLPAEERQLTSIEKLHLSADKLTSVPAFFANLKPTAVT